MKVEDTGCASRPAISPDKQTPMSPGSSSTDKAGSLHQLWSSQRSKYLKDFDGATKLAREANRKGEHFLAIEIAEAVTEVAGDKVPVALLQVQALALARIGSSERALQILAKLGGEHTTDPETLGLTARIYKELSAAAADPAKKKEL